MTIKPTVKHIAMWQSSAIAPGAMYMAVCERLGFANTVVGTLGTVGGRLRQEASDSRHNRH